MSIPRPLYDPNSKNVKESNSEKQHTTELQSNKSIGSGITWEKNWSLDKL